jgi:ABC-type branched-subunit amino acid transport system ATPase component
MLEIRDLATAYGKIEALKGVTLSARAGEVTCLLGPNGAGKTTLMMTLAGILKPQRGSITFEGEELVGKTPAEMVARGLALVPENRLVFPALSVRENLLAGAFKRGWRRPSCSTGSRNMLKGRTQEPEALYSGRYSTSGSSDSLCRTTPSTSYSPPL